MSYAKIKLIKDTVIESILSQSAESLEEKQVSAKKAQELLEITRNKLELILSKLNVSDLPRQSLSKKEFEEYLVELIMRTKEKLIEEISREKA